MAKPPVSPGKLPVLSKKTQREIHSLAKFYYKAFWYRVETGEEPTSVTSIDGAVKGLLVACDQLRNARSGGRPDEPPYGYAES